MKNNKVINMEQIYCELSQKINSSDLPVLIAVDGRCAAGKSTLAAWLKERFECTVNVIHMDDFFLQPYQRTRQRMEEPGGNIDYERFEKEVMYSLSRFENFSYQIYDCKIKKLSSRIYVEPAEISIVEGSYSCHPALWDFYTLRIFLDVEPEEQLRRICGRNGAEAVSVFRDKWIPLEEKYFTAYQIQERSDFVFSFI
ncbi:MAG: uridine kinase [Lachnospiraceae bacterium]|nr:uridine kinase [Lachnospiraceae bacterium]MCI9370975.1 uridine kinase [Lachnospiraceae bacterium]